MGLYGLIETFQDPWTAATFANGEENYESGSLYQGIGFAFADYEIFVSDLRYEGTNLSRYANTQYKIKAGPDRKTVDGFANLQQFTKFLNESTLAHTSTDEWESQLHVDGFLRA